MDLAVAERLRLSRRVLLALAVAAAYAKPGAAQQAGPSSVPPGRPDPLAKRFGGPFSLISHEGQRVTDKDFLGRYMLVYFGFTRCTDTCPIDLPMIAAALDRLGTRSDAVTPIMISVDPEDSPAIMADYVRAIHPRLIGLTGSEAELAAAARAYRVHRRKLSVPAGTGTHANHAHHGSAYTIDHGSLTYLIGPDGQFLTLLPHNSGVERIAGVLGRYLPP
jgi:protein SCO1/2